MNNETDVKCVSGAFGSPDMFAPSKRPVTYDVDVYSFDTEAEKERALALGVYGSECRTYRNVVSFQVTKEFVTLTTAGGRVIGHSCRDVSRFEMTPV